MRVSFFAAISLGLRTRSRGKTYAMISALLTTVVWVELAGLGAAKVTNGRRRAMAKVLTMRCASSMKPLRYSPRKGARRSGGWRWLLQGLTIETGPIGIVFHNMRRV